jgi:hypothetical protein
VVIDGRKIYSDQVSAGKLGNILDVNGSITKECFYQRLGKQCSIFFGMAILSLGDTTYADGRHSPGLKRMEFGDLETSSILTQP